MADNVPRVAEVSHLPPRYTAQYAARLRGCSLDPYESLHSGISAKLYAEVIESEYILQAKAGIISAQGGAMGHPEADISKAGGMLKNLYYEILSSVPYMTGGQTSEDVAQKEREVAVAKYEAYRNAVLQQREGWEPEESLQPIKLRGINTDGR